MYENSVPVWVSYDDGRVVLNSNGTANINEAYIKDHLGNIRVVYYYQAGSLKTQQVNSYYPFGMNIKGLTANGSATYKPNEYLYNGKMMQDEMGLGWLDYGARFYDPVLGRWHAIDPFAEVYNAITPYHYAANNPIKNIDVKGKLLKDNNGNIIATSTGKIETIPIVRNNGVIVGSATYQEVIVYTDAGTSIIALEMIAQSVVNEGENDIDAKSNCHGWALGGGNLVIIDNDGAVNIQYSPFLGQL